MTERPCSSPRTGRASRTSSRVTSSSRGETFQVTNVTTGAFMPEPSPDGRSPFTSATRRPASTSSPCRRSRGAGRRRGRTSTTGRIDRASRCTATGRATRTIPAVLPASRRHAGLRPGHLRRRWSHRYAAGSDAVGHHVSLPTCSVHTQQAEPSFSRSPTRTDASRFDSWASRRFARSIRARGTSSTARSPSSSSSSSGSAPASRTRCRARST